MTQPVDRRQPGERGWRLESAVARSELHPRTFLIPFEEERNNLRVGQGVKLLFWIDSEVEPVAVCDRMWVLVVDKLSDGRYAGVLESTPDTPGTLVRGERVVFGPEHVAEIFAGPTGYAGEPEADRS